MFLVMIYAQRRRILLSAHTHNKITRTHPHVCVALLVRTVVDIIDSFALLHCPQTLKNWSQTESISEVKRSIWKILVPTEKLTFVRFLQRCLHQCSSHWVKAQHSQCQNELACPHKLVTSPTNQSSPHRPAMSPKNLSCPHRPVTSPQTCHVPTN